MILDASNLSVNLVADDVVGVLFVKVSVRPVMDIDRSEVYAWSVGPDSPKARGLGNRLRLAILAGKVFGPASVKTDVNGRTYLSADARVMGRRMNADLRRLGF